KARCMVAGGRKVPPPAGPKRNWAATGCTTFSRWVLRSSQARWYFSPPRASTFTDPYLGIHSDLSRAHPGAIPSPGGSEGETPSARQRAALASTSVNCPCPDIGAHVGIGADCRFRGLSEPHS